ncbi:uncharacterized protein LOC123513007 isoform X3 [Portunus trituberculatus]|nr:uncharacterized protein LOC123513007 isoform X3 [Portunus trituberculatus]
MLIQGAGSTEGGWENSAACLGTREQLTLLYHAALTSYSHVENAWREDTRERRLPSTDPEQSFATQEGLRDAFSDESHEECPEPPPDTQVTPSSERKELNHQQHSTTFTCEDQSLINPSIFTGDISEPFLENCALANQEGISHPSSETSESFTAGNQCEEYSAITSDPPGDSVCQQSENCNQNIKLEYSVSPEASSSQEDDTPGRKAATSPQGPDTSPVHPLLTSTEAASDTSCKAVRRRDCVSSTLTTPHYDAADTVLYEDDEHNSDDSEGECSGSSVRLSCLPAILPYKERSEPAESDHSDSESDEDNSESDSDSSVDYDIPPVDERIYDPQFDPYFYQGGIALDDVPDDQPIDYPCPYDINGDYLGHRQFTPHFSYLDHWSGSVVTAPGDLYRSQSQPEAVTQDQPLDGDAPLHVFLSQPIPTQALPDFSLENSLLRPRKQGQFSSLCSFGGSQLYTITEEVECDDTYDDLYSRRNYSESNLYFKGAEDLLPDSHFIRADLYYGDTDSDATVHSESSDDRDSTETLDQDTQSWEILESDQPLHTSQLRLADSIVLEAVAERDSSEELVAAESEQKLDGDSRTRDNSPQPENECAAIEYPDEFFLFCSEAEVTGVDVMESVDVLPYNNSKQDFTYFKVESKTTDRNSPIDHDFLLESYSCRTTMSNRDSTSTTGMGLRNAWQAGLNGTPDPRNGSSSHVYQNIPLNRRISKSNPDLALGDDEVDQGRVTTRPIYQNVPVPAKRYHTPGRDSNRGLDNLRSRDSNSNYYDDWTRGSGLQVTSPYMNVPHNGHGSDNSLYNLNSFKSSSSLSSSLSDGLDRVVPNGHSEEQRSSSGSLYDDQRTSPDLRYVGRSLAPPSRAFRGGSVAESSSSGSFTAYASNTSLDHDTFSKTSKIYKWNGSSSVSDLTSLSRDLSSTSSDLSRGSASACDLTQVGGEEDWGNEAPLGETSYAAWCARVQNDDGDDQDFVTTLGNRDTSPFVFTPHQKAAKRAMMEFCVHNLSSDTDSDASTSSTTSSTSSSDDDCEADGRSYQVTAPGEIGLATIEEDAEEDSGAESSGHWMFSADNTDTDSVIHVPAALTPAPVESPRRHPPEDGESTASDETLVVEDDEEDEKGVCGGDGEGRGGRQEAGVTVGNSLARTPATTPAAGGHYDSSASEDEHSSQGAERPAGGSSLRVVHRRRRKPGDGRPAGSGASLQQTNMLGSSHSTRIFEKHVEDVFDFESLESCESVSGGSEASSPGHLGSLSGLEEPDAVFNMSATSQPFADASPIVRDEATRITTAEVSSEISGELEGNEGSSAPSQLLSEEARNLSLASTPSGTPAGRHGEEIEGDLNNVISNSDTDLVLHSTNSDSSQPHESSSGPQSMDMFGLPVRWTPGHDPRHAAADTDTAIRNSDTTNIEAEKTSVMQMRSNSDTETFANTTARPSNSSSNLAHHSEGRSTDIAASHEVDLPPLPDGGQAVSTDDVQVGSAVETMVACEAQQQEAVSAAAFTPYTTGENSSEARHCHSSHGPAHHHHISLAPLPQQSEGETLLLPPSCAANQDANEDDMRDALLPPLPQGNTATKRAVRGVVSEQVTPEAPDTKPADIHSSREAGYISSSLKSQPSQTVTFGTDLPSGDSDTDTDNTDGDYDEEDHFAAELSLRISSMPAASATKVKSFRSSDILNLIGLERGGAGPREVGGVSDDVSPPASQAGSSPEVPDSLRSSEGRSATRSVETLSEDSGLGDRDVRLTPSSPLAPISEAVPSQAPTPSDAPVSSRPRRQDVRQARIARARSLGDLRSYSDSDSEEEEGAMYRWPPHPAAHQLNEGMNGSSFSYRTQQRPYKPSYTNYLQQQQQQRCGVDTTSRFPPRPLPFSGSEGSDEELRSRFTNHRVTSPGHSKPRRHKSFHEASRQDSTCWPAAEVGKGTWATPHGAPRHGRRRPQPISVDLAEQFLSQEGLKSPQRKQTVENPYGAAGEGRGEEWRMQHPPSLPGTGGVAYQAARAAPTNQKPPCEASTNGVCVGSVGSGSEQCPPASSLTQELTVLRAWPAAQAAPSLLATPSRPAPAPPSTQPPVSAPLPHQYSSTPAQLPNECQPVHTGRRSSSPTHDPPGTTDTELRAASDLNEQCLPRGTGVSPATPDGVTTEMAEGAMRVHTKTYGSHGEVEVYLAKCDNGCRPPNTSPVLTPRGGAEHRPGSRGVTFSPSVKEINWRESYYEAEPEGEGSGSDVRKVLVVTSESPTPQRVDLTPSPPPSHVPTIHSQDENNTPESSPAPTCGLPHDSDKSNGRVLQAPAGSSSDAEMSEDKSPKVQTPLWQRFKLPKISSPKSPRPKIPPKPQSLSSRSSDTESSKLSSPGMDSSSSTPSSPDTKVKKAPSSPRFFSWGSKREKKVRVLPPRPLVSPPPPPAQVNAGQRGEVTGDQGGVKGEPDPATAVSPAALPREDRAGVSDNSSEPVRQEAKRVSAPAREERVTRSPVRLVSADKLLITDSDGLSHGSGRSPLTSATSGEDSSDAGQQHSPRSALSKPPLPPHLQRPNQQVFHKARLLSARRQYFSQERQVSAPERSSPPKELPPPLQAHKPRETPQHIVASRYNSTFDASSNLKERFERFSASARAERERLARSTPDLSVIEASVRRQGPRIDLWSQSERQQQQAESHPASPASASDGDAARPDLAHRGASSTHQKARAAIHERYKNRAQRIHARARSQNSGVLETDLDTGASREVLTLRETNLDDLYRDLQHLLESIPPVGAAPPQADKARAKSLLDLEATATMEAQLDTPARPPDTRAKSMEFLLDDGNKASIQPPENELMKGSERQLSEAELRVRRSLQRLDVPEWMKNAPPPQQGFLLRRREYGSSSAPAGGWSAYSSKTASMTSLGSSRAVTPNTPTKVVIPTRVASRGVGGVGGITSPASNCSISPSPSDRSGSLFQYPISRWSTSRLNSGTTTPTGSVTSSRTTATYTRQPYLGWRSQTSLANLAGSQSSLTSTGSYLTAADRLALGITAYSQRFVKPTPSTQDKENSSSEANAAAPKSENLEQNDTGSTNGSIKLQVPTDVADVHSSIKEVTSAIVHYCNESTPSPRASPRGSPRPDGRAPSPRRLVWVESSFVGSRPITSPETPTSSTHAITPTSQLNGHDLPESGEVPSRPPQPPEVVSLVNSLSSACSSLRDSSRDSTAASTNDSTAVIVDSSLGGDSSRADSRHSFSDSGQSTVDRSTVDSRHSTADTVNSGLSSRNIDSLNSRSSVLSSRSSGECSSRGSVGSSSRSSSSRAGGSRDDIEASPGSGEADDLAGRPSVGMFEDDLPVSVSASSTLVVRPALHPSAPRSSPVVLSTFQGSNNEVFQFGTATPEESRRSSEVSGGATEGMCRERHTAAYGETVGYDELFKSEESGDELFTDNYGAAEPDPHGLGPDSTTLEDVLDSLLALPSASRSPSPVCGHHPLGRPFSHPGYTKSNQEKDNTLPSSPQSLDCPPKHQDDHYGNLRNHNLPTDCKPDGYHKSFSYSSSSGDSSFQQQQQQAGARPLLHQQHPPPPPEGSPVSFFLARDEGESTEPSTGSVVSRTKRHYLLCCSMTKQ